MTRAMFEEKQFESAMNRELLCGGNSEYVPGLVFERIVGFDSALFANDPFFWRLWKHTFPPRGIPLDMAIDFFEHEITRDQFPKFKINLFIQYKRPEFIKSHRGCEMTYWDQPYFRYNITDHQQEILEKLEDSISNLGLVVYGSPAFYTFEDLFKHIQSTSLVRNTNFTKASTLKGHKRYTFISQGNYGIALSEKEQIKRVDILEEIEKSEHEYKDNNKFLYATANKIEQSLYETKTETNIEKSKMYQHLISSIKERYSNKLENAFFSYVKIRTFSWLYGIEWLPIIETNREGL